MEAVLARVSDDVDKREGSLIYTAVAPVCAELAQAYIRPVSYTHLRAHETD